MPMTPILVGRERIRRRRVVAKGERVEHAGGALGASVAGIGAGAGEGDGVEGFEGNGCFGYQCAQFPVTGVEAEGDGGAVCAAQASVGAEDEDFRAQQLLRLPPHACVLAEAEEIAGGRGEEHFRRDGQQAARARRVGRDVIQWEGAGFEDR
jgi:hypothetical protein